MAKQKEEKKQISPEEKKKTITAFLLMFPALIVGFIAIVSSTADFKDNLVVIALLILQFVLLEQFIKDFYRQRY